MQRYYFDHNATTPVSPAVLAAMVPCLGEVYGNASSIHYFGQGAKRQLALEVLWNTYPIASAIRTGKVESIDNYLITGREDGMLSFDESVRQLLQADKITREVAEALFVSVHTVDANLKRIYRKLGVRSRTELANELRRRSDP